MKMSQMTLSLVFACASLVSPLVAQQGMFHGGQSQPAGYSPGYFAAGEVESLSSQPTSLYGDHGCDAGVCDGPCGCTAGLGYGAVCNGGGANGGLGCPSNGSPFSGTIELKQDSFFGFHTILNANYQMTRNTDFTFYSILWTTPLFGFNPDTAPGLGLWTEVGAGVNYRFLEDRLSVNPQLGFLNGTLLSGVAGDRVRAFEGIVPNIMANWNDQYTEAEIYYGQYLATRGDRANDFAHWWINGGVKPFADTGDWRSILSTGLHFEHLANTRANADVYMWAGPYVQFALPSTLTLRFASGWDVSRSDQEFYQANIIYSF